LCDARAFDRSTICDQSGVPTYDALQVVDVTERVLGEAADSAPEQGETLGQRTGRARRDRWIVT